MTAANKNIDVDEDDSLEAEGGTRTSFKISRKKIFLILIPVLILVGILSFVLFSKFNATSSNPNFHVVQKGASSQETVVFYDLPPLKIPLKPAKGAAPADKNSLRISISLETSNPADIQFIDGLSSEIADVIITHTVELYPEEIEGIGNLYWLKEELLYRINMLAEPVKINNLNFKTFEIVSE